MKYPIGIQNFEEIREGGYLYIDKTDMMFDLVKMLKNRDSDLGDLEGVEIDGSLLESNDTASKNLIPVIYQSGYLTIKDYDKKSNIYKLGFPNKHVKNAFMTLMKYI